MIYDEEHYNQVLAVARSYRNDVERLEQKLAITEKALELAVDSFQSFCPYMKTKKKDSYINLYIDKIDCDQNCSNCTKNYYKQQAKEMLENENRR